MQTTTSIRMAWEGSRGRGVRTWNNPHHPINLTAAEMSSMEWRLCHHRRLLGEKGRAPTTEELAQAMRVTVEQINTAQSIKAETGGPSDLVRLQDIVRMDMAFDACC